MKRSETIKELATALANAQGDFKVAEFDRVNPHFKNKYASLTSVMNAVREPMKKNGLSVVQVLVETEKGFHIETTLLHASGEWLASDMPVMLAKEDMQGLGSAITYAKRYAVSAMLGVVSDEDDDANAATGKAAEVQTLSKNEKPAQQPAGPQSKVGNVNARFGNRGSGPTSNGNGGEPQGGFNEFK